MPEQIPAKIKNGRYRDAMLVQQQIAHEIACQKVGRELQLLVDQPHVARSEATLQMSMRAWCYPKLRQSASSFGAGSLAAAATIC